MQFTISKFVLPRLKHFKEVTDSIPNKIYEKYRNPNRKISESTKLASEEWKKTIDRMILAFQRIIDEDEDCHVWEDRKYWNEQEKIKKDGLKLFAEYFQDLWW